METGKITISSVYNDKEHVRRLLHTFIEKKIQNYSQSKPEDTEQKEVKSDSISPIQYHASLWMVCGMFELMSHGEIAKQVDVSCELLKSWETEEVFSYLTKCNYREFLVFVADLFA